MKNAVDKKNILWQHLQASGMEGKMAVRKGLGKGLDSLIVSKNEGSPEKEIITENVSHETFLNFYNIIFYSKNSRLSPVANLYFFKYIGYMVFNSPFTYAQYDCNFFIKHTIRNLN